MRFTFTSRGVSSVQVLRHRPFMLEGAPPLGSKGGFLRSNAIAPLGFHLEVNP